MTSQDGQPDSARPAHEYRTAELAAAAGITVRTLRFYRERKLLPPPRREGRIAWYAEHHLARLRTIAALLERGHTLGGIGELIAAFTSGRDTGGTAELLGLAESYPWAEEEPVRLTPEALAERFDGEVSAENLATALEIGYLTVDGAQLVHVSRALLDASAALVREGIPLATVLAAGREVHQHAEAMATLFTRLMHTHVLPGALGHGEDVDHGDEDIRRLTEVLERLRPLAKQIVHAEVSLAMDRRLRTELRARTTSRPEPR